MFLFCPPNLVIFFLSLSFSRFAEHFIWKFMLLKHMGQCQGKNLSQNKFVMIHFNQKEQPSENFHNILGTQV